MQRVSLVLVAFAAMFATPLHAAQWPARPIRLLTAGAGGGSDVASRVIAEALGARLGQPVVVDSRVGGVVIAEIAAKAAPDGYTFVLYSNGLWLAPLMLRKPTFDGFRDFTPITMVGAAPMVLVVNPALPVKSVGDLIALAKSRPGELTCATGPRAAAPHLAAELFKSMTGVDYLVVSYRSVGAGMTDLLGGRVQVMFPNAGAAMAQVKAGKVRALGVASLEPTPLAPGVPTIAESGLPGFESGGIFGLFGPAHLPADIVKRVNEEAVRVIHSPEAHDRLFAAGIDPAGTSPEALRRKMQADVAKMGKVIKAANIRLD
jgi:tripartite-type tricarboxylate transporter receptor subunit TctC